ncbi:hypothetical protein PINS_up014618 [Pythium insidiosum]|nr:hypothetical protein PINS_up014618 [Pythium insidiosum]
MEHSEKNVRSLAACCFAELLRVYAPDMPFKSNEELYDAFQLLLEQVRCLAVEGNEDAVAASQLSSTDLHHVYVLESLATVKSCLLLVGMDYTPDDGDEPLMVQLFRTLFNTIRKEHSAKIENLMLSIMVSCIEESDTVEQPLLDVILAPLVQVNPVTNGSRVDEARSQDGAERGPQRMAQELLRRTSDHLQSHISHFFNTILVDATSSISHRTSELKEHVYTLIYELHKINPSLLLYVLPNVCMQLQVDEVATRSEAIALMGRLFASSHADFGHDYMKNFRDFLGRFRDVSKEIRLQMVQVGAIIWQRKPELGAAIEKEFIQRLSDPEWEVRRLVVNEVCDLAANNIDVVGEVCLRQVGERMKDKKVILRKETMTGLSQVYAAHVSSYWECDDDDDDTDTGDISVNNLIPAENIKKLGWIPDFVLKCFAYPQQELKLRVVQLLDDILLPKAFDDSTRAKGLLFLFHGLDSTSKEALRRILGERAKCRDVVKDFITFKKNARGKVGKEVEDRLEKAKDKLVKGLSPMFPETEGLVKLLDQLTKWKDHTVFKLLEALCDGSTNHQDSRVVRDKLIKSVGSKTPQGEFLKNLCRKLNFLTVNGQTIQTFLAFLSHNQARAHRENRSVIDLLTIVSKAHPTLISPFVRSHFDEILIVQEEMHDDDEAPDYDGKVFVGVLNVLANYAEFWKKHSLSMPDEIVDSVDEEVPSDRLKTFLSECCLGEHRDLVRTSGDEIIVAKHAAFCVSQFFGDSKDVTTLAHKLSTKKHLGSPHTPAALPVLQSIDVFAKRCSGSFSNPKSLIEFLFSHFLLQEPSEGSDVSGAKSKKSKAHLTATKATEIRCLTMSVITNLLLHCASDVEIVEVSQPFIQLMFELLRTDGKKWSSTGSLPTRYRGAAAASLLKLVRNQSVESSLSLSEWHLLGFVLQDSSEGVRESFLKKLAANLVKRTIPNPHKYLSFLALCATESNQVIKKRARALLTAAVERMRRTFEAISATSLPADEEDAEMQQQANALMVPEYSLPYVIHLLAHHPDFPEGESMVSRNSILLDPVWSTPVSHLSFFLDGLVSSNANDGDNIAFLLQMLAKLSNCHDVMSESSTAMYPLVECAVALLKRRIKNQSNLKSFPGKIYLPKQLYAAGKRGASAPTSGQDASDHDNVSIIQRRVPRMSTSLSPIKPSGLGGAFMTMSSPPASAQKRRPSPASSSKRKSPKPPAESKQSDEDRRQSVTPTRRQSLMRKARAQAKTFVDESSESEDDFDSFVPAASVASRSAKRESVTPATSTEREAKTDESSRGTKRSLPQSDNADDTDDEMANFRGSRRRRQS